MSRAKATEVSSPLSLFPFIGVLLSTMGALLVVLIAVSRSARDSAVRDATEQKAAASAEAGVESGKKLEFVRQYVAKLAQVRADAEKQLRDDQQRLSHMEDHMRRLREQYNSLQTASFELETLEDQHFDDRKQAEREVERLGQLVKETQDAVDTLKDENKRKKRSYSIIPYDGPHGTQRRPIYIECRKNEVLLQPEEIRLTAEDFRPPLGAGNPLAAALRAAREYIMVREGSAVTAKETEPYPLILVRPDGIMAYYRVREAIQSWDAAFGYELVDDDWKLEFPPSNPQLAQAEAQAIELSRSRQQMLMAAAPRAYGGYGSGGGGGFEDDEEMVDEGSGSAGAYGGFGVPASGGPYDGEYGGNGAGGMSGGSGTGQGGVAGAHGGTGGQRSGAYFASTAVGGAGHGENAGGPDNGGGREGPGEGGTENGSSTGSGGGGTSYGDAGGGAGSGLVGLPGTGGGGATADDWNRGSGTTPVEGAGGGGGSGAPISQPIASNSGQPMSISAGPRGAGDAGGPPPLAPISTGNSLASGVGEANLAAADRTAPIAGGMSSARSSRPDDGTAAAMRMNAQPRIPAADRGRNWAIKGNAPSSVPMRRPIHVIVRSDRLAIQPDAPATRGTVDGGKIVTLEGPTIVNLDEFVRAVQDHVHGWGLAGSNLYWRPVLVLNVGPDGQQRADDLARLLRNSGIEIRDEATAAKVEEGGTRATR